MKAFLCIGVILSLISCSRKTISDWNVSERTYRDYVLYRCLETGLDAKNLFSKDLSLSLLYEESENTVGEGKIGHYLDSLVEREVNSIHPTEVGFEHEKVIYLSCMDYYNSKALRNDIKKVMKLKKECDLAFDKSLKKAVGKKKPLPANLFK